MEVAHPDALNPPPGTSLIETLRLEADGALPLLSGHLARLHASSQALGYPCPMDAIEAGLRQHAQLLARGQSHRLRLLLDASGRWRIEASALLPLSPRPAIAVGESVLDAAHPLLRHKTTHRPWYEAASRWLADRPDHFDVVFFNQRGELCEGSRSNVYLLRDGAWLTPALSCGVLPGVQRAALLAGEQAHEAVLTRADLARAEGIRLSNALRGWFDVRLQAD